MSATTLFIILMVVYVVCAIAFGTRKAKKQDEGTVKDWYVGGGKIPWPAVGFTMAAAWLDMATVFLNAGGGYQVGISAFWDLAGAEMLTFVIMILFFAKPIRHTNMISQGEMLELRYGSVVRPWYSLIWTIVLCGYAALSFLVFNEFVVYLFGISKYWSAVICLVIVLGFQLLEGFAATVYADYIQGVLIIIGCVILGIFAVKAVGGWGSVKSQVPPSFLNLFGSGIGNILSITVPLVLAFMIEPTVWMRVVSAKSLKDAKKASGFAFLIYIPVCMGTLAAGLASYVLYKSWDQSSNMIAIDMASKLFPTAITALVYVGIIAAMISSFNAFMMAANQCLSYDLIPYIYKKRKNKDFPENKYRSTSRICLVIIGIVGTFISLWLPTLVKILQFSGSLAAAGLWLPVVGMFYSKKANKTGALLAFAVGTIAQLLFFVLGNPFNIDSFYLSFPMAIIAFLVGNHFGTPPTKEQLAPFIIPKDMVVK